MRRGDGDALVLVEADAALGAPEQVEHGEGGDDELRERASARGFKWPAESRDALPAEMEMEKAQGMGEAW